MSIPGLIITLRGTPRPQPRARHVGGRVISTASPKARAFRDALRRQAKEAVSNIGGPNKLASAWGARAVVVDILCQFPTPKADRWGHLHTHKPDKDNLEKMALDALTWAGALGGDDSRAATGTTSKIWGPDGFITIAVRPASQSATRPKRSNTTLEAPPAWLRR